VSGAFREKFITQRYQLSSERDKLRNVFHFIRADQRKLTIDGRGLRLGARKIVRQCRPDAPLSRLVYAGKMRFSAYRNRLDLIATKVGEADPAQQFRRGYTITTRANGKKLADGTFEKGEILMTQSQKYVLTSKLTEVADEGN